jgi:hypothetical protein
MQKSFRAAVALSVSEDEQALASFLLGAQLLAVEEKR